MSKISFDAVDDEDKAVKLRVCRPSPRQLRDSQIEYNGMFADLVNRPKPALLREKLDDVMREQGLWDDEKQAKYENLVKEMNDCEIKLAKGGILLASGKELALRMRSIRREISSLVFKRTQLDNLTAQGLADDFAFEYLVSECTVYDDTGKRYFKNADDYRERSRSDAAFKAAQHLATIHYGIDSDFERKLPENQFLTKYKFIDDGLRLINGDGKLIDEKGRLVNENYQLVDADGNRIDEDGNRLTADGELMIETAPFLDESGQPIA